MFYRCTFQEAEGVDVCGVHFPKMGAEAKF